MTPLDALNKYWGYTHFLPNQKAVITSILEGKDCLAILPTGAGKSLCYQLPALLSEGICLVVSPLLALMQDQVVQLNKRGIKSTYIKSNMNITEVHRELDNCLYANYKLLYLSPERLKRQEIFEHILNLPISFVAVDEAHCISQWGHDFRPAYRDISKIREQQPKLKFVALTATANSKVASDIIENLKLKLPQLVKDSFQKEQLSLQVLASSDKISTVLNFVKRTNGSGIIYIRKRQTAHEIAEYLKYHNINAAAFHAGIDQAKKDIILANWLANKIQVVVATTAFGMGIDKADVRYVIHYHLPESLESYYQEIGRAGRDRKPAKAVLFYNDNDIIHLKNTQLKSIASFTDVKTTYKCLNQYFKIANGEGEYFEGDLNFTEFCKKYSLKTQVTYHALQLLDKIDVIKLSKNFNRTTKLQFIKDSKSLLNFLDENQKYHKLINTILRTYGGIFDHSLKLNIELIAQKSGLSQSKIFQLLEELAQAEIIAVSIFKQDLSLVFLVPREDNFNINPYKKIINSIGAHKQTQVKSVIEFISEKESCLEQRLLAYFDEIKTTPCGKCSNCKSAKLLRSDLKLTILEVLSMHQELSSQQIISLVEGREQDILTSIKELIIKNKISLTSLKNYKKNA